MDDFKKCKKCGLLKSIVFFCKHPKMKDGYFSFCNDCINARRRLKRINDPAWREQDNKKQRLRKQYHREWRDKNKDKVKAANDKYRAANEKKISARKENWRIRNLHRAASRAALYRSTKKLATPSWVDEDFVLSMYQEAQYQQMHVDHIVPLVSKKVCGLHWEGNLQLLDKHDNFVKNNRVWPDQW